MSVTSTAPASPVVQTGSAVGSHQSQWALVGKEFRKRRLAVFAAYVLLALVTVSVFAPFLANDRPIYYSGINRYEFREAGRTLRALLKRVTEPSAGLAPQDARRSIELQFTLLGRSLPDDARAELQALQAQVQQALATSDLARRNELLQSLRTSSRPQLDALEARLVPRGTWPVVWSLSPLDIGFMVAVLLVLTGPFWRRLVRSGESHLRRVGLVYCLAPALCAILWWLFVPARVDLTQYKSAGVLAAQDTDQSAGVVFHSVLWPPITYAIDEYDLADKAAPPAWYPERWRPQTRANPDAAAAPAESPWVTPHWMGSDASGRDVLCRMLWGGRISLSVGIVAVAIYVSIGIVVGAVAGYFRGVCDIVLSRIIEVVICFPSFFLILTIVAMVGPGLMNIMIVIGLTGWTGIARLVRGEFLRLVDQEFVLAGRALGYSPLRLIFRHVLPNAMAPVLVSATFGIAGAILTESALSFLGLGISKPTPSWGSLLADGREALDHAPWLIHFPGLAIFITITAYNLIGEALRDAADPRLRGSR